jgi:adenine deaminase
MLSEVVVRMQKAACAATILWSCAALSPGLAQERSALTVFENVRIFDGKSQALSAPSNVLIRGNTIERIAIASNPVDRSPDTRTIASGGRVLMPGLSDMHWFVRPLLKCFRATWVTRCCSRARKPLLR